MKYIESLPVLRQLARDLRVRHDWHEPDEQNLTARVEGVTFNNAGFWPTSEAGRAKPELHVILTQDKQDVACVNLATLFAWACRTLDE
jgi:hypothetical protein